jgi:hypothetical protein
LIFLNHRAEALPLPAGRHDAKTYKSTYKNQGITLNIKNRNKNLDDISSSNLNSKTV